MPDSYPFPMYSGLLVPMHYKRIGSALWLFAWFISSTTREEERDDTVWGIVLGNKPLRLSEMAEPFDVDEKTIRRWLKALEQHDYIQTKRAPYGLIVQVRKSKKYQDKMDKNVHSDSDRSDKNVQSSDGEWTKMSNHPDKNVHSNKDITEILAAVAAEEPDEIYKGSEEIANHFAIRRGKGFGVSPADFDQIKKMIVDGVPIPIIKTCIDQAFAEYKPRHRHDEIRSISYCVPRCYDEWYKVQSDVSITSPAVPSAGSVALGASRKMSKAELELEQLRREKEEAKRRAGVGS